MSNPTIGQKTSPPADNRASLTSYITGFVLSLVLTLIAYQLVANHILSGNGLISAIVALAIAQLLVQLVFFLHLGSNIRQRWNVVVFGFMLIVLGILVIGTLWIMNNLHYHMDMTPHELDTYIIEDEGVRQ